MVAEVSFGEWLRRRRKAEGWTQEQLALQLSCSTSALKKIESEERRPSAQIVERLAEIFNIPPNEQTKFLRFARGDWQAISDSGHQDSPWLISSARVTKQVETGAPIQNLPSGTVTFLFTDIEGSSRLAQAHPKEWETLLERHHAILRESIESNNGYLFQVVGDGFCAAFHTPNDGLHAAVTAQQKLQTENWGAVPIKVRMGIHTGEAKAHDHEYRGYVALSLVQRLMSAGHGGQILLSQATENLLRGHLPKDLDLRDLGEHKFKDILQPVRVFQVIAPELQKEFPALRALNVFPNNLPIQLTSFIGREKQIEEIIRLLGEHRLVTLTGPGGVGKTRLAIQSSNELLGKFDDGVWSVELAPLTDGVLVPQAVAQVLGVRELPNQPLIKSLKNFLHEKELLLILDNCEHLIVPSAQFAFDLLSHCANLRILTTSREALGITGEMQYPVPTLSFPKIKSLTLTNLLLEYESIRLFIERACAVKSDFVLTEQNAAAVLQICQRLDGISLALELAAARTKLLSVEEIAGRLNDRFNLLTQGSRTALPRHQTLRAAIDWSHNLLTKPEQVLFHRLAIFVGGFTLEAAETVAAGGDVSKSQVADLLGQLIDKSLVAVRAGLEDSESDIRYGMLETIREYAREKLRSSDEEELICAQHLKYFLQLSEQAEPALRGSTQMAWLARLTEERDNLRTALSWAAQTSAIETGLYIAGRLRFFWERWNFYEGEHWLAEFINKRESHDYPIARAKALCAYGLVLWRIQKFSEAREIAEECLALFRACGDPQGEIDGLLLMESVLRYLGTIEQVTERKAEYGQEALALAKSRGDRWRQAQALAHLGWDHREYLRARAYWEEAVDLFREVGDFISLADFLGALAELEILYGDFESAQGRLDEAIEVNRQMNNEMGSALFLGALSKLATVKGDFVKGRSLLEEALTLTKESGDHANYLWARSHLGHLVLRQGNLTEARDIFSKTAQGFLEGKNDIGIIFTLEGVAGLYTATDKYQQAARLIGWSDAAREKIGDRRPPIEQADMDREIATCVAKMGEGAFAAAYDEGKAMSFDEAMEFALKETKQ
jgi:predicted ATPase/class 3 adenylate cyclase